MNRNTYKNHLHELQTELSRLQDWVTATGYRAIIVFEGRDAAGKGGAIGALTRNVSPRVFRVNALPVPSDREKTQYYLQRYIARFPAAGEIELNAGAQTVTLRGFGGATFTAKLDGDVSANASGADVFLGQTATFDLDFSQAFETDLDIG